MKKRVLSLFLALVMVLGMLPASGLKAKAEADYDLRVLTFEDEDYWGNGGGNYWSALIDNPQYGGPQLYGERYAEGITGVYSVNEAYSWYDGGNTELQHTICIGKDWMTEADYWCYWNGGHAVSNYVSGDLDTYGSADYQLTVYQAGVHGLAMTGGGHDGSDNFAVHNGYMDGSEYNRALELPVLSFGDGVARVIDHMYVTNINYDINCMLNGNGFTEPVGEEDWLKIVATGYHGDGTTATAEFYLCNGPDDIVTDWTKWDLYSLGAVTKVEFNVLGSNDNGFGVSQPAYFAYDDVAVRFNKTAVAVTGVTLDKETAAITVGESVTLIATVHPEDAADKTVSWTSDNESVATVADGVVTGVAAGTANITVTAADGGYSAVCSVSVTAPIVIEPTVIYTGTDWPYSRYHIASLTLEGAVVDYIEGGGNTYHVYLNANTEKDAEVTLTATADGKQSGNLGINYNDNPTNTKTYTTNLTDGEATIKIYAYKASGAGVSRSGTKTFYLHTAAANTVPELTNGVGASLDTTIKVNESYELDLNQIFIDADMDELTYTVSVNGGSASAVSAAYSYSNTVPGTYVLKFTATDGKISADVMPTYTVNLTIENLDTTYDVKVITPEGIAPTYYAVSNVENGTAVPGDMLSFVDGVVKVPQNITRIAWSADGLTGMSAEVSADTELELAVVTFSVKTEDNETDTNATVQIKDAAGCTISGAAANTYLIAAASGYTYTITPGGTYSSTCNKVELTQQTAVSGNVVVVLPLKCFTVIAPVGSVVSAGTLSGSYKYDWSTAISSVTEGDRIIYRFSPLSGNAFIRVQRPNDPDTVTYWDYKSSKTDGKTITVTEEMLFMNDGNDFNANTVYRNFEKYMLDLGDIYMNINEKGYINLEVGGTKALNMFRSWQAIESFTNEKIALPDFSYEIITIEGENVVSIVPDANNSAVATLTAKNEGTVIVLVTYDAMYSELTATGAGGGAGGANRLSAIWPDRTGVFVVSVGKDGTDISTNMTNNGNPFDAELSPLFYVGTEGADISFKPESSCTVTVNRSTVGTETLSFGEFTSDGVTVSSDGTVTVSGLTTGRHIIRVEKDGVYTYQVVTAQQVTMEIKDAEGNTVTEETVLNAGDSITISLSGLTNPVEKMATAYNFSPGAVYADSLRNFFRSNGGSGIGTYNFSSQTHTITVTIPADWTEETYGLSGYLTMSGMSAVYPGGHRNYVYGVAKGMASGSTSIGVSLGELPELTFKVKPLPIPATGVTLERETITLRVTQTGSLTAIPTPSNTTDQISWTSDDETVATVENGVVKAVGVGETTITVTVGGYSAQCLVKVDPAIEATTIILNQTVAGMEPGRLLHLSATVGPEDTTDKTITWSSSDEAIAVVDANGVVSAKTNGIVLITATVGDVAATCKITVKEKTDNNRTVTVYLSVSHDDRFMQPAATGKVMALQKVEVPYFDLSLYGLEKYMIPESSQDYGKVTALHLYLYATEVFYYGVAETDAGKGYLYQNNILGTDVLAITGGVGSAYMNKFWGYDENLNYYLNYQYPTYGGTSIGATADRIVLKDGDVVTVGHFENWSFYDDPTSIFNYILVGGQSVTASVTADQQTELKVYRAGADMGNGGGNTPVKARMDVYYVSTAGLNAGDVTADSWTKLGTTAENGVLMADISSLSAGQYILAVAGQYGTLETTNRDICSAPGAIILNVMTAEESEAVSHVISQIDEIGEVTLEDETAIKAARDAYEMLSEVQKSAVTNYAKLQDAENELAVLKATEADKEAAEAVETLINTIGAVALEDEEAIKAAREAYEALTDTQKRLVDEAALAKLIAAEKTLQELKQPVPVDVELEKIYKDTGDYLYGLALQYGLIVNADGGEWIVVGLERADRDIPSAKAYYDVVLEFVETEINDKEQLHRSKSTENSRVILALTALGYDVTDVGGHNLLVGLNSMSYLKKQGINGPIWALIAFDSHDYEIPTGGDVTREVLIDYILSKQLSDGGWALSGDVTDVDMTGMAIQALAPYYESNSSVKAAIDEALTTLSGLQLENGGFGSIDGVCAESAAQMIVALTALGINPDTDARFVKNGKSVLDSLCSFCVEGGGFEHIPNGGVNGMASEQGYYALVSYFRFLNGKTGLYDMSDVTIRTGSEDAQSPEYEIVSGGNTNWKQSSGKDFTVICNGEFADFIGLLLDGTVVDSSNYTAVEGSTIVTLKAVYLEILSAGEHTLTFKYVGGEISTKLTVLAAGEQNTDGDSGQQGGNISGGNSTDNSGSGNGAASGSADTGDHNSVVLWAMLMMMGMACTAVVLWKRKRIQ